MSSSLSTVVKDSTISHFFYVIVSFYSSQRFNYFSLLLCHQCSIWPRTVEAHHTLSTLSLRQKTIWTNMWQVQKKKNEINHFQKLEKSQKKSTHLLSWKFRPKDPNWARTGHLQRKNEIRCLPSYVVFLWPCNFLKVVNFIFFFFVLVMCDIYLVDHIRSSRQTKSKEKRGQARSGSAHTHPSKKTMRYRAHSWEMQKKRSGKRRVWRQSLYFDPPPTSCFLVPRTFFRLFLSSLICFREVEMPFSRRPTRILRYFGSYRLNSSMEL